MMDIQENPFDSLDYGVTMKILKRLTDAGDIVRATLVSRSWHEFIISNAMSKQLCLDMFPQLSVIVKTEEHGKMEKHTAAECSTTNEWGNAVREHKIYSTLAHTLSSFDPVSCISEAMFASSTDNYPEESIFNTLDERDEIGHRAFYWSSSGKEDPSVPETLTYKLLSNFCVISEINIQPFEAYFQPNSPIYSAKAVRFRMGFQIASDHEVELLDNQRPSNKSADDCFVWNYTSPVFPMTQVCELQHFKLPHPVLCIGGILQVELLDRVQTQEVDGLFYVCVSRVQAMGRSLFPLFGAERVEPFEKFTLTFNHLAQFPSPDPTNELSLSQTLNWDWSPEMMAGDVPGWEHVFGMLIEDHGVEVNLSDDEENHGPNSEE